MSSLKALLCCVQPTPQDGWLLIQTGNDEDDAIARRRVKSIGQNIAKYTLVESTAGVVASVPIVINIKGATGT